MADIKTNQSKVYNALKGMGFSGIGANEQEFAAKMGNPKNRAKVYKALSDKGYKGIGKDQAAFDTLIYQAQEIPEQMQTAKQPEKVQQASYVKQAQNAKEPAVDAATGKPLSPYLTGEGARVPFVGTPDFEPSYEIGEGENKRRRKVSEDIYEARHNTKVTPAVQQVVDQKGNVVKENVITPVEPQEVAYDRYLKESASAPTLEQQNQKRLDEVNKKLAKSQEKELRETASMYNESPYLFIANAINMAGSPSTGANMMMANNETENRKLLEARQHLLNEGKRIIDEVKLENSEGDVGVWGGLKQAARNVAKSAGKMSTWDFGATDVNTQSKLMEAIIRMDNGDAITEDERELLSDWALNNAVSSMYGNQLSGWAKAGQVTGESLPFMLEMAINPASGLGQAAQKGLVKYAMKKYGKKWVKDHAKGMLAGKIATRVVGDILGGQTMAATTGLLRTVADAEKRYSGEVNADVDDDGNVIYGGHKDGDSALAAFSKAWAANGIENSSEMWGEYLAPVTGLFRNAIGKAVIGKAGREALNLTGRLGDISLNKAQRFIYDVMSRRGLGAISQGLDKFLKKTQWHGVLGEYIEEELGNLANAAVVGDMTFDNAEDTGIFNLQQHIDTFNGVALMGGFMSALHTGGYALDRYKNRMSKIDKRGYELFSDWDDAKTIIDSVADDPVELNNVLTDYLNNDNLSKDEKKTILDYTGKILERKGADMAEYQPRMATTMRQPNFNPGQSGWVVTSLDRNGNPIEQQSFDTEDEAIAYEGELKMRQQSRDMKDYLQLSTGLSYGEGSKIVDDFLNLGYTVEGMDLDMENDDDKALILSNLQNPKTMLGRAFRNYKNDRAIAKARASREAIAAFEEQNGWEPGTIRELAEADPMQLSDEELQMADQAREFLKGLAYPAGEVHIEHEQQEGTEAAKAVVENVISTEEPIDPNNNAGQQIFDANRAAEDAIIKLFTRNEDLKEEFYRLQGMGLSPQEIISSLDSFRPGDVQVVIDYFNANARYMSFMEEAANEIDSVAHRSRESHTMKGTIDGVADVSNVHTITDGTNRYYLVSGDVTTDPATGRITGSNSGLIIGMDLDGSFVQLNESDGYSLEPVTQTLDQFEEAERERLGQQVTQVIDPTGSMMPQEQQSEGQASAEAGANSVTGANEAQPAPSVEAAQEEAAQPQQPAVAIESVTDKDGIKRYENGIAVDDAIADIQNDGDDVNEIADASIAEAQQAIDKINNKASKTRKDLMDKKNAQATIDYYNNLKARWAEMNPPAEPAESEEIVNVQPEEPIIKEKPVSSQSNLTVEEQKQQRIAEAKAKYGELFDDDFTKAEDAFELASMWVGRKRNLAWEDVNGKRGLQKELGWTRKIGGDTKYIETLLAKNGEGIGIDEFVHMVWQSEENMGADGNPRFTTEEIKEALLDLIKSAQSKSDVVDYALNTRIAKAEAALQEQRQRAEEEAQNPTEEVAPITDEEQARIEASLPFARPEDGVDIPENPINALWAVIREVSQDGGMPAVRMVDTDQMTDGDWIDFASEVFDGAFVSEEDVNTVRSNAFEMGIVYNDATDTLIVFSGAVTPESLRENLEQFKQAYNETEELSDTDNEGLRNEMQDGESAETPAAEGANEPEGQRSPESVEDPHLQPRNAEEEQIIANVLAQLQQEIGNTVEDANKARTELEKARAKESERATDLFANDETFAEPDAIFSQEEMGLDTSAEGVERRTAAQREKLQEATNKLNRLQSIEERNSRIRGALDNYRRQTSIEDTEKEIKDRHKQEYEKYIKPLLNKSDEELRQMAKKKEDEVNGDLNQLGGDLEYSAIHNVLMQHEYDRQHKDVKLFIENTIDDNDITFVDKLSLMEFDKLKQLIDEYGVDDSEGKIEDYVKRLRKKYPVEKKRNPSTEQGNYKVGDKFEIVDDSGEIKTAEIERINNYGNIVLKVDGKNPTVTPKQLDEYRERRKNYQPQQTDPMQAIEQAAQQFRQEQEEKKAYGADNKLVSKDRYEELKKRMRDKLLGQMNLGVDPEILSIGTEMAVYHIEAGARKFIDYATNMINDLGDAIRPYLKAFYEGARRLPEMSELSKEMDSVSDVDAFDVLNYDKQSDNTVNDNKQENNEPEKVVSSQQETSEEVGRKAEDSDKYRAFSQAVATDMLNAMETGEKPYKSINDIRKKAKQVGLEVDDDGRTDILLQELVEDGLVSAARQYVNTYMVQQILAGKSVKEARESRDLFNDIVKLYYLQPSISQRSSNRIKMAQFSTPLPMSFVADVFATPTVGDVLEPTAGNGMMVFAVPESMVHANELDNTRLENLKAQKFKKVTNQDATQPFEGEEQYDAIIANPPFGATPAKEYDGKMIPGLAEQIAINALSKMKDNGKAAIIIGGNMDYAPNGAIKNDKAFFTYLYDHYNVKGVIDMDGKLFSRQGTTYPTRMILIDGRRSEEERAQIKVYPPTLEKAAGYKVNTFDELYDLAKEIRNNNKKTDGNEVLRTPTGIALPDNNDASGKTDRSERDGQPRQNDTDGGRTERRGSNRGSQESPREGTQKRSGRSSNGVQQPGIPGLFDTEETSSEPQPQTGANREGGITVNNGESRPADVQGERAGNSGVGLTQQPKETPKASVIQQAQPAKPKVEEKRELDTDKLSYRPHNTAFSLESVAPAAMVEAMDNMLSKIEKEHGNIDEWVTKELGYDSVEDMHNALAAEQVDSVAMAIYQMKQGQGMIIGDQTGVGKGRQMAALIRWACRQGKKPVFITQKADLFSDIYRDLVDIGSGELRPFIFNSDGAMVDNNGVTVHKPLAASAQAKVFAGDKLPDGYDFAVLTYSQVNTGDQISQDEAKAAAKESGERYQKRKSKDGKPKATPKATFLRALANDNYMFLDESHTAAGKSNTGAYFQSILKTAKGVTFASATFAKRPDTMPMYAIRTAMSKAKVKAEELIKIIENGGVTLQEIMSRALTQAGQMVRRERDMSDVRTDWKTVDDPAVVKKARDNYDKTIEAFNAIINFQKTWVAGYLNNLSKDLADVASSAGMRQGTEDLGIKNVPFASKTYNYTKQLMLALKVDAIVDEVVKEIEAGRHPVIALENTMGSMLDDYAPGDTLEETTFAASLLKGLRGVLRYTITDEDGNQVQAELTPEQLGKDGEAAYHEVEDIIRESTSGIFISPLDAITEKLNQRGYKVGELTGRQQYVELDENTGEYVVRRRTDRDKKKMQREFNNGTLDVLILNKSASTGISLHASEKFSDQRQRTMIIAQPLADINDYMQMIGRIDRTGQVHRGYYINLGLPVPAEGRFLMMLSTKLKSLNANTTTSQESESNDVEAPDLLNKYGSKVVIEYLRDNPDIYVKMGEPLRKGQGAGASRLSVSELDEYEAQEDDARKVTGYVALLPTSEQDDFYNDVVRRYNELIKYLNDTGSNDLKISVMPLRAKTIEKQVSSEGTNPKGDNPFAGNAYVEWVEMDVLKKPMKAAEVGKVIEQLNPEVENAPKVEAKTAVQERMLNDKMTPRVRQIYDTVERETQAKLDKENERYEAAKKRAEEDIAAKAETINKQQKRTEEQKREAIDKYASERRQNVEESHQNMVNKIDASHDRVERYLTMFKVGDSVLVPDDLTIDSFLGSSPGIFCGFKAKDEGITPSTTLAVFCTLDGRRKIEVKLSDWEALARINNMTEQNWDAAHEVTLSNWDSQIPSETRKQGFIMTGNILQAFADAGEGGRVPGQLVTYTDIDGNVHDGILMNQHWEPSQLKGSTVPIRNRIDEIKSLGNGEHVTSADGNVVIERMYRYYIISVPKSKKLGGQYYENDRLLDLVDDRNFYPSRGTLKADIPVENIDKAVDVLSDIGVQMKSENQVQFDTVTEMGQAKGSTRLHVPIDTVDPMEAINQAADSWRSENEEKLNKRGESNNKQNNGVSLPKNNTNGKESGSNQKQKAGLEENESSNRLSRRTRSILDRVAKQLGITIRITDRESGADSDGKWNSDTRTITLSLDVANDSHRAIMKVFGHELTHAIKQMSEQYPEVWDAFVAVIKERIGEKKWKELFDAYRRAYDKAHEARGMEKLDDAGVEEEICADVAGDGIFTDEKFVKDLIDRVDREGGDVQSFIDKMLDFIKDIVDRIKAVLDINDSPTIRDNFTLDMAKEIWADMYQYAAEKRIAEDSQTKLSLVKDKSLIDKLENEPKVTVYRAMQLQNGKLYPPMAAKVNGKWQDPLPLGEWSQADEHPELVNKDGKFDLDKGNGKKVAGVVYAPYMHGSTTMLNDQFKEAQDRPELVVVEAEMPESELTSGYQAEKSPRKTGMLDWKAGTIQGQLTGTRKVMLSRWVKPIRIVPSSEVAASIKQMIDGQVDVMPTNVVTPEQREELEKLGVKFVKTDNKEIIQEGEHKGEQYSDAYGKKSKQSKKKEKRKPKERLHVDVGADPMEAINSAAEGFKDGQTNNPMNHSAKQIYDERLNSVETVFAEAYQDAMVSLKTAQNAIAGDKEIPDSQNAYQAENLMHGKNKNEQDLFNRMFRDPMIATINKIMNLTGMNWGDVDRYVYTKSGLERNREFFVRDWLEAERKKTIRKYEDLSPEEQDIYDDMANTIETMFEDGDIETEEEKNKKLDEALQKAHKHYVDKVESEWIRTKNKAYQDLKDGNIPFYNYLREMDNFIFNNIDDDYKPEEHDYSGFRAMFGDENGVYDEAEILIDLEVTEDMIGDDNVEQLWSQINAATRYGLERYREAGMRSDEQIDRVEEMFHFYVPMRGFKEDRGEDMYQYFTGKDKSKSYVGGLLKHAKGRGSEANYPISTIFAMSYKAISDCNQNLVNQKLYRLCQANPNDLIILSDSWAKLNEVTGEWEEVGPDIPEGADEEDVRQATQAFEDEMNSLALENKAKKIKGKEQFDYKPMDKKKQSEHIIDVRINGQPRKMIVTGNPRMAQALNGQLRFERGKNVFSKWNSAIKNMMASLFTSYSPTFALRNMFRDWTHFRTMLGVREGHGYAKQANKYYRQSLFKMVGLFKKYREGTLDESNEMERDFKDFMDNGGVTGFVQMQKIDDIQKQMEKLYKQQKKGKTIRLNNKIWDYTLGAIEAINEGIENNARFATYRASRHYAGRTKARSAYDAKEITVNFNRKGAGSKTAGFKSQRKAVEDAAKAFGVTSQILGEGKIFFNATVQAIATTFKNFQNADGSLNKPYIAKWAAKYALPPFMFGLLLPMINKALAAALGTGDGDDDPYANLAEWTRRKNLCFYVGNGNFITIPVGQELAAFLTLGDIIAGNTYAPDLKPVDKSWDDEILGVMNTFSPVDVDTKITKGGLMEDPISEVTGRTFSVLAPLVAVEQNLGWTGRPIYREDKFQNDPYTPEYQMVYSSTNPVLVNASKLLHELGGGDDITRGKLEVNPAIVQYLWEQYTGGPGKVFSNTISIGKDAKDLLVNGEASDFNIRKVEGLKAFVQQGDDRTEFYRANAKYRKYKEDAERLYDAVTGYENAASTDPLALPKLEKISMSQDFVRMQIVREADKQLSKINKAANKAEGKERKELRRLYNEQVKAVVDMLDEVEK